MGASLCFVVVGLQEALEMTWFSHRARKRRKVWRKHSRAGRTKCVHVGVSSLITYSR